VADARALPVWQAPLGRHEHRQELEQAARVLGRADVLGSRSSRALGFLNFGFSLFISQIFLLYCKFHISSNIGPNEVTPSLLGSV
jgi:hypothetical protein